MIDPRLEYWKRKTVIEFIELEYANACHILGKYKNQAIEEHIEKLKKEFEEWNKSINWKEVGEK